IKYLPKLNKKPISKTTITDIDQDSEMSNLGYCSKNIINMNNNDLTKTTINSSSNTEMVKAN
ncbi:29818_t:CDS:1, partial [Gigaspora margarita]